jgi:hypothetical protein
MLYSYNGWGSGFIWVPFDCYYHIWTAKEIMTCAKQKNISWLLVSGGKWTISF